MALLAACSGNGKGAAPSPPTTSAGGTARSSTLPAATTATTLPPPPPSFDASGDPVLNKNGNVDADVVVIALDSLKFDKPQYDGKADLTIGYLNNSSQEHRLHIEGNDKFELPLGKRGEARIADIRLDHGTYTIFCAIAGHRAAGMEAKLVIA